MHAPLAGSPGGVSVVPVESHSTDAPPLDAAGAKAAATWWTIALSMTAVVVSAFQIATRANETGLFVPVLCFVVLLATAVLDAAYRRIPNLLTYPAIMLGLIINTALVPALTAADASTALTWLGAPGLREGVLGFLLCAFIGVVSFMARGLGGGDVKVLAAVGAILGLSQTLPVLFNTLVIAATIGAFSWALGGRPVALLQAAAMGALAALGTTLGLSTVCRFRASEAPFAVSLLLGLVLAQFIQLDSMLLQPFMDGLP